MTDIGIVVIGRNEGERLRLCLASAVGRGMPVVYVDSNSSDGSVAMARAMGAEVVNLDMSLPFSAARARNAGFERLSAISADVKYVQFIDGDCEIVAGWMDRAAQVLRERPEVAVVCGRRRERFPDASIYNRLADLEWDRPVGEVSSCGGDAMMRVEAFRAAGGFNPSVVAGEEPELCQRLRDSGHKILRIDAEMTLHDSAMLRFNQWWRRQVRSGYGAIDVASRFGGHFVRQVTSTRLWTIGWLLALIVPSLLLSILLTPIAKQLAIAWFLLILLAWPAQVVSIASRTRPRVDSWRVALAQGALTMIGKWANLLGQYQYWRDRGAGRTARLIEYKTAPKAYAKVDA